MLDRIRSFAIVSLAVVLAACSGPTQPVVYTSAGVQPAMPHGGAQDTTVTTTPTQTGQTLDTLVINTSGPTSWDGVHEIKIFGSDTVADFTAAGQSFTTGGKDTLLTSFTFFVTTGGYLDHSVRFIGYVAQWDGSKVVGGILWKSAIQTGTGKVTFTTGNLRLNPNAQYIVFLSTIETLTPGQYAGIGYAGNNTDPLHPVSANPYSGGRFFYLRSGSTSAFTSDWSVDGGGSFDAAVIITLSNLAR
jgi:hypothetical protein